MEFYVTAKKTYRFELTIEREKFFDAGKVKLVSDDSDYHEQTEELEATEILKNYIDRALEQDDIPCLDEDGNGVEVTSSNTTIENVEW